MPALTENKMLDSGKNYFEILRGIGEALNSSLEPEDIFKIVLETCIRFTRSDTGSIISINKETKTLDIEHQVGLGARAEKNIKLKIGEGVTGTAAQTKKPILVNDVSQSKVYIPVNPAIRSEIAVPIIHKSKLLGVISVDSKQKENYKKEDLELLTIVASQVGQVLTNLEIFQELKLRVFHDEVLMEISRVLSSSLEMDMPLGDALFILKKYNLFDKGALILWNEYEKSLEMKANFGYSQDQASRAIYQPDEGVVGKVYKTGKPEAIRDVRQHPVFLDKTGSRKQDQRQLSFFCIPLISGGKSIGIMIFDDVFHSEKQFTQKFDFLKKLEIQISKSLHIHFLARNEKDRLQSEFEQFKELVTERTNFGTLVGRSEKMKHLYGQIEAVANSEATVLITGESGTGKELVATQVHLHSKRREKPLVAINCAAIPEHLLESELFGYKRGAFTGATTDKPGKFHLADGGTIFLDEIGEMPILLQSKLLRVLQEGVVDPVGSRKPEPVNVRVIAATNKVLYDEIKNRTFREDLYYRLSIVPIHLPPLRERREDIPLLVEHFLGQIRVKFNKPLLKVTESALQQLVSYQWDGNIRELRNVIERSAIFSQGDLITRIYFDEKPPSPTSYPNQSLVPMPQITSQVPEVIEMAASPMTNKLEDLIRHNLTNANEQLNVFELQKYYDRVDRVVIEACLKAQKGVHQQAAKTLGISRETLRKRIRDLEIDIYSN